MLQVSRIFFVVFMVTWFITRLYYFPAYVLNSTLFECLKVRPLLHVQSPTAFLLCIIVTQHDCPKVGSDMLRCDAPGA